MPSLGYVNFVLGEFMKYVLFALPILVVVVIAVEVIRGLRRQ